MPKKSEKSKKEPEKNILRQSADGYVQMYHMGKKLTNKMCGMIKRKKVKG